MVSYHPRLAILISSGTKLSMQLQACNLSNYWFLLLLCIGRGHKALPSGCNVVIVGQQPYNLSHQSLTIGSKRNHLPDFKASGDPGGYLLPLASALGQTPCQRMLKLQANCSKKASQVAAVALLSITLHMWNKVSLVSPLPSIDVQLKIVSCFDHSLPIEITGVPSPCRRSGTHFEEDLLEIGCLFQAGWFSCNFQKALISSGLGSRLAWKACW